MTALEEGFADRGYLADGTLVPRGSPGALIDDPEAMLAQALSLVNDGSVTAQDGRSYRVHVDTICLHGDGPHALEFAMQLRARLLREGFRIAPC